MSCRANTFEYVCLTCDIKGFTEPQQRELQWRAFVTSAEEFLRPSIALGISDTEISACKYSTKHTLFRK